MNSTGTPLRIGFIPLVDAASLIVAVDKGFAAQEGLDVSLIREVSWSNIRDKLTLGLFEAAHLLAPVAIASSLGLGHVKVPLLTGYNLGVNGNAITVAPALYDALMSHLEGDANDPLATAQALARLIAARKRTGDPQLIFGMTFPFSTHNYQLRFWMAAGGVDPDNDVHLVVLPPPYMVDSLARGHVDAFCVGAPWNSTAVDLGIGHILHFSADLFSHATEKVLAVRSQWADSAPDVHAALIRACDAAAGFIESPDNREEVAAALAKPDRLDVNPEIVRRTLEGRLKVSPEGSVRQSGRYMLVGREHAARPDPNQALWFYAQMVRWGQAKFDGNTRALVEQVFRPDLYDAATGKPAPSAPTDMGAFFGPTLNPDDIPGFNASFAIRWQKPA